MSVMPAVVVSGVVIFAGVLLLAVACLLVYAVLDRRAEDVQRQAKFLDGLRRVSTRAGARSAEVTERRRATVVEFGPHARAATPRRNDGRTAHRRLDGRGRGARAG